MAPRERGPAVIGEHPQPNPPLHATGASVPAPPQSVTAFECADASFAACTPAQSCARGARALLARLARQRDVPDPTVLRRPFIGARGKTAVGHGQLRGPAEERDVPIQGGCPQGPLRLALLTHLVVGDELPLGLLDFTSRPNSVGFASLPLRMISVCGSKTLTTLLGKCVSPRRTRARVCARTCRTNSIVVGSTAAGSTPRASAASAWRTTARVIPIRP
jgi:hypothetical protein